MMELFNCLIFGTPNGLSIEDMNKVKNKLFTDFDWLCLNDLNIKEIELGKKDGEIIFIFDSDPFEMVVCVTFDKSGSQISVNSNVPEVCVDVFNSLCELEWGWIEL